jgi:hypothetical protein
VREVTPYLLRVVSVELGKTVASRYEGIAASDLKISCGVAIVNESREDAERMKKSVPLGRETKVRGGWLSSQNCPTMGVYEAILVL